MALASAVAAFDPLAVDPATCVAAAQRFAIPGFQHALRGLVEETFAAARQPVDARRVAAG